MVTTEDPLKMLRGLKADEIAAHIEVARQEERLLKMLLRVARAKEKAEREKPKPKSRNT